MSAQLSPTAVQFIGRMWRGGAIATLNKKGATGAVNNSQWLAPEQLQKVVLSSTNDLYFSTGTATQIPPTNAKGEQCADRYKRLQNAYLASVNALYTEFDFKGFASAEAATEHVANLPHQPSVIINSGGGLHCYWLLDVAFVCTDETARERLRTCISAFVTANGGDTSAKDLARVLRVPDTFNTKYTPPRRVSFVRCDYEHEYQFETLETWALSQCPPPQPKRERVAIPAAPTPPSDKAQARAAKYFYVMLARRCDALQNTPAGQRYHAIGEHATTIGGYCHLLPNGEQVAREALFAACAHYDNQPKTQGWIEAALGYGIAHPADTPDFTAPPKRTPQQTETDRQHIAKVRAAVEARQWHGKATIETSTGKTKTLSLSSVYRVLAYALDVATAQAYNRVLLSARTVAINVRMSSTRAAHCIKYLHERGYLQTVEKATKNSAAIYSLHLCKTNTPITQVSSVSILHRYKSASCARRVTITKKHERFIGEGARRRYANGPTLDDVPLDAIQPNPNWRGAQLLRAEPEREHTTYDGLGEASRHVLDLLTAQPYLKRELATITGASMDTIRRVLTRLERAKIVVIGDDRRSVPTSLSDDWITALDEFYETGNIAEHQTRIRERCERERQAWQNRNTQPISERLSDDVRAHDIAQTIADATLELSPTTATPEPQPVQIDMTPETQQPAPTAINIAHGCDDTSNAFANWYLQQALIKLMNGPIAIRHEVLAREFGLTPTAAAAWLMTEHGVLSANMGDYLHMRRADKHFL